VTTVRPGFLVALLAALVAAGFNLAFTSVSRAKDQRVAAALLRPPQRSVHALRPITHDSLASARARADAPGRHRAEHRRHAAPAPVELLTVRAGRRVALHARPGGRVVATLGDRTEFGSRTVLSVIARRARWASVPSSALPNGRVGWIDTREAAVDRRTSDVRIAVRLSERRVEVRVRGRLVRRVPVAIGRPGSSTPRGRFSVTDKIAGDRFGPYYGCCILALSGHQPNTPPGWTGGDRLAIHGTNSPSTIGTPSSAGCLRAADDDLRVLMRRVPVGTPVVVRG
jgi:hypothetical protein